jgi:hypothetical protein
MGGPVMDVVMAAGQVRGVQQAEHDHGEDEQRSYAVAEAVPLVIPAAVAVTGVREHRGLR